MSENAPQIILHVYLYYGVSLDIIVVAFTLFAGNFLYYLPAGKVSITPTAYSL